MRIGNVTWVTLKRVNLDRLGKTFLTNFQSIFIWLAPNNDFFFSLKAQWYGPFLRIMEEVIKTRLEKKAKSGGGKIF